MEKKLLIAVDPSIHSQYAIDYALSLHEAGKNLKCTLFNVQPAVSTFLLEEAKTSGKANTELKRIIQHNATSAQRVLSEYKEQMVRKGWDPSHIDVVTHPKMQGTAKDIMDYAQMSLFDAILLGRRGVTRAQEVFTGSVTTNLLEHSRLIPVWVVDKSTAIRHILATVDGSAGAMRMVDHLSFILRDTSGIRVTLFHVTSKPNLECPIEDTASFEKIWNECGRLHIETFCTEAKKRFSESGLEDARVEVKVAPKSLQVGKAILNEAKKGNYDTVVVGRSGEERAFFMGSVSRYVLRKLGGFALWLVP